MIASAKGQKNAQTTTAQIYARWCAIYSTTDQEILLLKSLGPASLASSTGIFSARFLPFNPSRIPTPPSAFPTPSIRRFHMQIGAKIHFTRGIFRSFLVAIRRSTNLLRSEDIVTWRIQVRCGRRIVKKMCAIGNLFFFKCA